jgi:endo-1,4-beta-xylanase
MTAIASTGWTLRSSRMAFALQSAQSPAHADEMTVNSAPQDEVYSHYNFGPLPASLPPETEALRGRNSLKYHASQHGLIAGASVVVNALEEDPAMQRLIEDQYAILVPAGALKWRALRPSATQYDFGASDWLFEFAKKHSIAMRGHTLVWHNSVPDWLQNNPGQYDVRKLMVEHIRTVVGRYKGRVQSWDVVNEAILPKDGQQYGLRKSFWYENVGPDYIELAYRTAHEADPQAKLTYNDYGVEYDSDEDAERRKYILALVRRLQSEDVPLQAVGIQSHIKAGSPYAIGNGLTEYMESIGSMALEIYLTELDVNEDDLLYNDVARRDRTVADTYSQFLGIALANRAVKMVLTWGVSNRRTWLNDGPTHHRKQPNRPQRSLPFDSEYRPTEAFFALRNSFDKRQS